MKNNILITMGILILAGLAFQGIFGVAGGILVASIIGIVYGVIKKNKQSRIIVVNLGPRTGYRSYLHYPTFSRPVPFHALTEGGPNGVPFILSLDKSLLGPLQAIPAFHEDYRTDIFVKQECAPHTY